MTALILSSDMTNGEGIVIDIILIMGIGAIIYYFTDYQKEKKEKVKKEFDVKMKHQNFILATTNNFPPFKVDKTKLDGGNIVLYNELANPEDNKVHGVIKIIGKLVGSRYSITVSMLIVNKEYSLHVDNVTNNIDELTYSIHDLVTSLLERQDVKNAITLTRY